MLAVRCCKDYISTFAALTGSKSVHVSKRWLSLSSSLLEYCQSLWRTTEQLLQAKKAEEDSLYRYKAHKHVIGGDEEGEVEDEVVRQMFPVYDSLFEERDNDVFEGGIADGGGRLEEEVDDAGIVCQFTCEEMKEVSSLHHLLFVENTLSDPLRNGTVLSQKYSLAALLADNVSSIPGM